MPFQLSSPFPNDHATAYAVQKIFGDSPFTMRVGFTCEASGPGWCRTVLTLEKHHLQHSGVVHAGVMATMADQTAGAAAFTMAPPSTTPLTVEFKINLLRPATGTKLVCLAQVLKAGRHITVVTANVFGYIGETEKNVAHATVTIANG